MPFASASVQYLLLLLFAGYVFECCIERQTVLNHQPLSHPDVPCVGFLHCMLSNVVTIRDITKSTLSVEITRNDRRMFWLSWFSLDLCIFAM